MSSRLTSPSRGNARSVSSSVKGGLGSPMSVTGSVRNGSGSPMSVTGSVRNGSGSPMSVTGSIVGGKRPVNGNNSAMGFRNGGNNMRNTANSSSVRNRGTRKRSSNNIEKIGNSNNRKRQKKISPSKSMMSPVKSVKTVKSKVNRQTEQAMKRMVEILRNKNKQKETRVPPLTSGTAAMGASRKINKNFKNLRVIRNNLPNNLKTKFPNQNLEKVAKNGDQNVSKMKKKMENAKAKAVAEAKAVANKINKNFKNLRVIRNNLPNNLKTKFPNQNLEKVAKNGDQNVSKMKKMMENAKKTKAKSVAERKANSARVSATTLGAPNQSLNNNANSLLNIKPAKTRRGDKSSVGKLMKEGILLEITKQAQRTAKMSNLGNLKKLNTNLKNPNSIKEYDTYAWALLYDIIRGLADTKFDNLKVNRKTLNQIHEKLRQKNAYSSGRTSEGEGNRRTFTVNFNDDEIVEFMFLIWLDGSHDEYITSSFLDWIDSPTCKHYFLNRHRDLAKSFVKEFPDPKNINVTFKKIPIKFKNFKTELFQKIKGYDTIRKICIETEAVWFFIHDFNAGEPSTSKKMIDKSFTSLSGKFEAELKLGIKQILNVNHTNEVYTGAQLNNLEVANQKIVSLDMETAGDMLSEVIRINPNFRPYITVANLIDPGKHMLKTSAGSKDAQLVLSVMKHGRIELLENLKCHYYIGPLNFTIKDKEEHEFFKINLSIKRGGPPITNEDRVSTSDFFDLEVNGKKVMQGATASQARNGPSKPKAKNFIIKRPEAKMGKLMGDALQYMVVAIQNKYRGRERYFASGDGSACFMYVYFCKKFNVKPRLIIDRGDQVIRTVGLRPNKTPK